MSIDTSKKVAPNPLDAITSAKDKRQYETTAKAGGLLARAFRTILADVNISGSKLSEMIRNYLHVTYAGNPKANANDARGSLNKDLAKPEMSFGNFLTGLKVLTIFRVEIDFTLYWSSGRTTKHRLSAKLITDEDKKAYEDFWKEEHGVQKADEEYKKRIQAQYTQHKSPKRKKD